MPSLLPHFLIMLLAMLLVAFFAGAEIAFLASSWVKIELKMRQGSTSAKILSYFKKHVSEFLITILMGTNIALIFYTQQIDVIFEYFYHKITGVHPPEHDLLLTFVKSVIDTLLLIVLAEYIPKAVFRRLADTIIYPSAYLFQLFYYILWIPVQIANFLTKIFLKMVGIQVDEQVVGINKRELEHYIQEVIDTSEGTPMQEVDTEMLSNAMTFDDVRVKDMMIPRTDIVALPMDATTEELMQLFIETKHSRILIYKENLDYIEGFVHSTSMFNQPAAVADVLQPVLIVPEVMTANTMLKECMEKKKSVAVVVDEFGGTAGMVTLEDVAEEVFGDIQDEHDTEEANSPEEDMIFEEKENQTYIIGARQTIDDLREEHELDLPESEHYTTLGGFILHFTETIPHEGEILDDIHEKYKFAILTATPTKIIKVKMERKIEN